MQRVLLLSAAVASVAFAGTEEIRALIQNKLNLNLQVEESNALAAIDCTAGQSLFCPLATVPNGAFSVLGGSVTSTSSACCPAKYTQCQVQQNAQYCRDLVTYEIPENTQNNELVCPRPPTIPTECDCQTTNSGRRDLRLRFCPSTEPCCPICECHGDPHCRAFNGKQSIWATCDDRDAECVHGETTCANAKYDGKACTWVPTKVGQSGYCTRADGTKVPQMLMYAKTYKKYFTPADNNVYTFSLRLTLGTYGSITKIEMTDSAKSATPYVWQIDSKGECQGNPTYPIGANGRVSITDLPSMVDINFQCFPAAGRSPTAGRFDVHKVQDPWFIDPHPQISDFTGFCVNGVIEEAAAEEAVGACNTADRQIVRFFGCTAPTTLDKCKSNWCAANYDKFNYPAFVPPGVLINTILQKKKQCTAFVNNKDPAAVKNFLAAVCSVSIAVNPKGILANPLACASDPECKSCMDNILDFPEDIATILQGDTPTIAPTKICDDLLTIGLNRKTLLKQASGVQIDFFNTVTNLWTGVFALLNEEIDQCDCQSILVNGTDATNLVLTTPGKYRIKQCNGLDTSPEQEMCISAPSYNTTVIYTNPSGGALVSQPYGEMYNEGKLVCNKAIYPGCPPDYACCIWEGSAPGWDVCMSDTYGSDYKIKYPSCKFPSA